MDKFKRSTKNNRAKYSKKFEVIRLSFNTSSLSTTSKTTSYTEDENEYNPDLQYDDWEIKAILAEKVKSEIKDFFVYQEKRQNTQPHIPSLVIEKPPSRQKDNISLKANKNNKINSSLLVRQDSIILSRNRMKERNLQDLSNIKIKSFSLPSSPREFVHQIHKFEFSSSSDEFADCESRTKRTFSDDSIPKIKRETGISHSKSHKFKRKKWHSNLRITSLSVNSPRKDIIRKNSK